MWFCYCHWTDECRKKGLTRCFIGADSRSAALVTPVSIPHTSAGSMSPGLLVCLGEAIRVEDRFRSPRNKCQADLPTVWIEINIALTSTVRKTTVNSAAAFPRRCHLVIPRRFIKQFPGSTIHPSSENIVPLSWWCLPSKVTRRSVYID